MYLIVLIFLLYGFSILIFHDIFNISVNLLLTLHTMEIKLRLSIIINWKDSSIDMIHVSGYSLYEYF
jgi:hypothetical protein